MVPFQCLQEKCKIFFQEDMYGVYFLCLFVNNTSKITILYYPDF